MHQTGIVSYAQNFEDVMLWRALHDVDAGFYIDIGAQHPRLHSVSRAFHEKGWQGVHVEPLAAYCALLEQDRPGDTILQAAVAAHAGTLPFFAIDDSGLSTHDVSIAARHRAAGYPVREIIVPAITLDELLEVHQKRAIHWLKIDVEGAEKQVLQSWQSSAMRPWIIVIESTLPLSRSESHLAWEALLLDKGYSMVYADGLNRFYLSSERSGLRERFQFGPNVFDGFQLDSTTPPVTTLKNNHELQLAQVRSQADENCRMLRASEQRQAQARQAESRLHALEQKELDLQVRRIAATQQDEAAKTSKALSQMAQTIQQDLQGLRTSLEQSRDRAEDAERQTAELRQELAAQTLALKAELDRRNQELEVLRSASAREAYELRRACHALATLNRDEWVIRNPLKRTNQSSNQDLGAMESEITDLYRLILGRDPDVAGLTHYVKRLQRGASRPQVLLEIACSPELHSLRDSSS